MASSTFLSTSFSNNDAGGLLLLAVLLLRCCWWWWCGKVVVVVDCFLLSLAILGYVILNLYIIMQENKKQKTTQGKEFLRNEGYKVNTKNRENKKKRFFRFWFLELLFHPPFLPFTFYIKWSDWSRWSNTTK